MNPLVLNAFRWFLMLGGILLLVSGVFGLVFNRGWRGLLLPAGSVAVLMLGGVFAGLGSCRRMTFASYSAFFRCA